MVNLSVGEAINMHMIDTSAQLAGRARGHELNAQAGHEQLPHTHTRTHLWMRVCIHRGTRVGYSFVLLRQTGKMAAIETSGECKYPVIVLKVLAVL